MSGQLLDTGPKKNKKLPLPLSLFDAQTLFAPNAKEPGPCRKEQKGVKKVGPVAGIDYSFGFRFTSNELRTLTRWSLFVVNCPVFTLTPNWTHKISTSICPCSQEVSLHS